MKRRPIWSLFLLLATVFAGGCETMTLTVSAFAVKEGVIAPPHPDPNDQPASFLVSVANDLRYDSAYRRDCVHALFRHHVRAGMTLSDLARLLEQPNWLREESVCRMGMGTPPLVFFGCDTYEISVFPEFAHDGERIYLGIERNADKRNVDADSLVRVLQGKYTDRATRNHRVAAVTVYEPPKPKD